MGDTHTCPRQGCKRTILVPVNTNQAPQQPRAEVVDTYVDHHATCPKVAEWKGRRR